MGKRDRAHLVLALWVLAGRLLGIEEWIAKACVVRGLANSLSISHT